MAPPPFSLILAWIICLVLTALFNDFTGRHTWAASPRGRERRRRYSGRVHHKTARTLSRSSNPSPIVWYFVILVLWPVATTLIVSSLIGVSDILKSSDRLGFTMYPLRKRWVLLTSLYRTLAFATARHICFQHFYVSPLGTSDTIGIEKTSIWENEWMRCRVEKFPVTE